SGPSFEVKGNEVKSVKQCSDSGTDEESNIPTEQDAMPPNSEGDTQTQPTEDIGSENYSPQASEDNGANTITNFAENPSQLVNNLVGSLPQQALLDQVQGNSGQAGHTLANSNQFDQVQRIDQTLYQPSQPPHELEPEETPESPDSEGSKYSSCHRRRCRHGHC
ncbi:hypothetical protein K7432_017660, partial [Basidiobolus ranarum]